MYHIVDWLPRTRGDAPMRASIDLRMPVVAPHTRGCSRLVVGVFAGRLGCPAHAGMLLAGDSSPQDHLRLPRTRGDAPQDRRSGFASAQVAPHTRGCSRGHKPIPPRPHGCPAHAGMLPGTSPARPPVAWLPRTRGDAPFQAKARLSRKEVAPHTRGCSEHSARCPASRLGCPAHAGMLLKKDGTVTYWVRLPRTRGDAP